MGLNHSMSVFLGGGLLRFVLEKEKKLGNLEKLSWFFSFHSVTFFFGFEIIQGKF